MHRYKVLHAFILLSLYYFKKKHIDAITKKRHVNIFKLIVASMFRDTINAYKHLTLEILQTLL